MRIDELLRDDENERYIARHSVEPEEGEQVCFGRHYAWHQWGNRYIVLGQTEVGLTTADVFVIIHFSHEAP